MKKSDLATPQNSPYASLTWVRKANTLIQMNYYISDHKNKSLSLMGNKLIAMAISKIPPDTDPAKPIVVSFPAAEFWEMCGVSSDSGNNVKNLKNALMQLKTSATWVWDTDENGNPALRTISWATNAALKKIGNRGMIEIEFDPKINHSLLNLSEKFTAYPLQAVMQLESKYGFALYELLCSYAYMGNMLELPEERMLELMDAEAYKGQPNKLKQKVFDVAVRDINSHQTGMKADYELIKGKAGGRICVFMSERTICFPAPKQPAALLEDIPLPAPPPKPQKKNDILLIELQEKVSYEIHKAFFSDHETEVMDMVLNTVRKVLTSKKKWFTIGRESYLAETVKDAFRQFNEKTMLQIVTRYIAHEDDVKTPEGYLITSIYREIVTPSHDNEE